MLMRRAEIIALASKNQQHYLSEQASEKVPWFRCLRRFSPYTEYILVNQDMAKELLGSIHAFRMGKPTPPPKLKQFVDLVKSNEVLNHNVTISLRGNLIDGIHILQGIVLAEKSIVLPVSFNVKEE